MRKTGDYLLDFSETCLKDTIIILKLKILTQFNTFVNSCCYWLEMMVTTRLIWTCGYWKKLFIQMHIQWIMEAK